MKQRQTWLLALLSILTFVLVPSLATAGSSGQLELGVNYTDIVDNAARVNEYVKNGAPDNQDDGLAASVKLDIEATDGVSAVDMSADIVDGDTYKMETGFDAARILKLDLSLDSFQHWKDHENLLQLGATARNDAAGNQPRVTTDATVGQLGVDSIAEANARYELEMANDYIVTRKETEAETSLTLPVLPNITFHAGLRIEARNGLEQARTSSKCNQCHIQANAKTINERTEDFTFGMTGKFGLVTVEYEYLNREFRENATAPEYNYLSSPGAHNGVADAEMLLYSGSQSYSVTPDSEKDSHMLKARVDINQDSSVSASYVNAEVESNKSGDGSYSLDTDSLTSEFESFFLKGATRLGGLRLSVRGGVYDINGPEYTATFPERIDQAYLNPDEYDIVNGEQDYESAETRDVTEFGIDAVYRLTSRSILRLGYNYEEIDRALEELGDTKTHTFKAAYKARYSKQLSVRASYEYQNIDDPLAGPHTGIAQDPNDVGFNAVDRNDYFSIDGNTATAVFYWNSVYPNRNLETSMDPEDVHELKFSSTWAPSANMAATLFARVRMEENDAVEYEQTSYVPGFSFYYAPNGKLNLSMAYTFNKQDTENRMCVGWYHG